MVKVTINGEVFAFDNEHYALTEAIELEEGLGIPYGEYQRALARGSAKALAGFVWLVLKRDGRDTPLADILSGKFPLNDDDVTIEVEDEDPTDPPPQRPRRVPRSLLPVLRNPPLGVGKPHRRRRRPPDHLPAADGTRKMTGRRWRG